MKKHDYCPKHKRWHSIHAGMHCRTNTPICNTGCSSVRSPRSALTSVAEALPGPALEYEEGLEDESGPINDEHNGGVPELVVNEMENA